MLVNWYKKELGADWLRFPVVSMNVGALLVETLVQTNRVGMAALLIRAKGLLRKEKRIMEARLLRTQGDCIVLTFSLSPSFPLYVSLFSYWYFFSSL